MPQRFFNFFPNVSNAFAGPEKPSTRVTDLPARWRVSNRIDSFCSAAGNSSGSGVSSLCGLKLGSVEYTIPVNDFFDFDMAYILQQYSFQTEIKAYRLVNDGAAGNKINARFRIGFDVGKVDTAAGFRFVCAINDL